MSDSLRAHALPHSCPRAASRRPEGAASRIRVWSAAVAAAWLTMACLSSCGRAPGEAAREEGARATEAWPASKLAAASSGAESDFFAAIAPAPPDPLPATRTTGCSAGMARVRGFCIDRYEAYVVELDARGQEVPHSPYLPVDGLPIRAKVAAGVVPQGYISQVQSLQACQSAGKRLCSAAEFSLACRGPDAEARYPYGGTRRQPGKCNEGKGSAVTEVFGREAPFDARLMNDPRLNRWPGGLAKTGEYAQSVSPFGVFDLVGNLHEWGAEVAPNGHGSFRGGFYGDAEINGPGCNYVTKAHVIGYHDYSTGFRCCRDADPDAKGD